jgi:hypothetical protein
MVEHIKSRAEQLLSEWVRDDIHVDEQQNAQQCAAQPGSALSATDPPGWHSAALDHEPGDPVSVSILNRLKSSRDATIAGTAVVADESAEEIRMRVDTTDLSSLPVQHSAGAHSVRNPKPSVGSQSSPKVSAVFEPSESAQKTPESTSTGTTVVCEALDSARCKRVTSGVKPGDIDEDQKAHAMVTSSGNKTRGVQGDEYQEAGRTEERGEEELDSVGEIDQESKDEEDDDDRDDEDEEEDEHEEDDDKEERDSEGEVEPMSRYNDQGQKKRDDGYKVSRRRTAALTSRPTPPVGAPDSDNKASREVAKVGHNTRNSTDAAHRSASSPSTMSEPLSEHHICAVQEDRSLEARTGQEVAGLDGTQTVSARCSTRSRRSNEFMTESLTDVSTASPHEVADDNNGSADSDDSGFSTEGDLDADDDNRHTPIDEAELAHESSRSPKKRALTASAGTFRTPTKRHKLSDEVAGNLTSAVVKNVPSRLIQPPKLMQLIADMLAGTHKNSAVPLTCFFFSVASPFALRQLREACVSVRKSQRVDPATEEAGVWQSVRALDRIDMHEHVSPILRRYHLVKLVERRDQLYNEIVESVAQSWSLPPRRGLRKQTAAAGAVGTKKAAKLALERLVNEAYPENTQEMERSTAQYEKNSKILQNRLSNGHN